MDWADFEGPQMYHLSFCPSAVGTKTQRAHELDSELVSGGWFLAQPALFFEPGPFPELPYKFTGFGATHGPKPYRFIGFGATWGRLQKNPPAQNMGFTVF